MAKGAFRTPVYLFGSTHSGVGKSTLLANVAVFSHARGLRTAILDLNHAFPLQIRHSLPRSLPLEIYADLSEISQQISPRFRRSFYFTNIDRLSYFPAFKIPGPLSLLQDTSYRDFFLQLRGSFDQVFINLSPGINDFSCIETFASKHSSRESFSLLGVLVTTPDVRSLHLFDQLWRDRPAIQYLLTNQLLVVFNRVHANLEEQTVTSPVLSTSEIRSIFRLPLVTSIASIKEFAQQSVTPGALVLDEKSPIRGPISRLTRTLADAAEGHPPFDPESEDLFHPCLNSERLARFIPYLPSIQSFAARRLFIPIHGVTAYLEECGAQIRLRLRFTRRARPSFSRSLVMPALRPGPITDWSMPTPLPWVTPLKRQRTPFCWKEKRPQPVVQAIYQFDDRFARTTNFWPRFHTEFRQEFPYYAPAERFRPSFRIAGIMGLLESLGYGTPLGRPCDLISPTSEEFDLTLFRPVKPTSLQLHDPLKPQVSFPLYSHQAVTNRSSVASCLIPENKTFPLFERTLLPPREEVSGLFLRRWKLEVVFEPISSPPREVVPGQAVFRPPALVFSCALSSSITLSHPDFSPAGRIQRTSKSLLSLTAVASSRGLQKAGLPPLLAKPVERVFASFLSPFRPPRRYQFLPPSPESVTFGLQALTIRSHPIFTTPVAAHHVPAPLQSTISPERAIRFADFFLEKLPWQRTPPAPAYSPPPSIQIRSRFGLDPVLLSYRFLFHPISDDSGLADLILQPHTYFDHWGYRWQATVPPYQEHAATPPTSASLTRPRYSQTFGPVGEPLRVQPFSTDWPRNHRLRNIFQNPTRFSLHRAYIGSQRGLMNPFSLLLPPLPRPVLSRKALKTAIRAENGAISLEFFPLLPPQMGFPIRLAHVPHPVFPPPPASFSSPLSLRQFRQNLPEILKHGLSRRSIETRFSPILTPGSRFPLPVLPSGCDTYFGYTPREEWFHLNLAGFVMLVSDSPGSEALAETSHPHLDMPPFYLGGIESAPPAFFSNQISPQAAIPFHHLHEEVPLVRPVAPKFALASAGSLAILAPDGAVNCPHSTFPSPILVPLGPDLSRTFFRSTHVTPVPRKGRVQLPAPGNTTLAFLFFILVDHLRHHHRRLDVSEHTSQNLCRSHMPGKPHHPRSELRLAPPLLHPANLSAPPRLHFASQRLLRVKMARLSSLLESAQRSNALVPPASS